MLAIHIESDIEYGCHVFIETYFDKISYFSDNDIEKELEIILLACQPKEDFKNNFYKILRIEKDTLSHYKKISEV